jgi:serine/threonine protein kinase
MPSYDRTFLALLHTKNDLPRPLIISLLRQLLSALAYLNAQGLMHRDLKLENIMLTEGRRAVIIDMGMTQQFAAETYLFEQCGTPGYLAPDLFGPRPPHPERCDIFSLGVIFHIL